MKIYVLLGVSAFAGLLPSPAFSQITLNQAPSRAIGHSQLQLRSGSPNLVEGRELFSPWAVTVDRSTGGGPLYVSDTGNHRVLGWRSSTGFSNGAPADVVIGQLDRFVTTPQGPGTARTTGLNTPGALAVDGQGNLYVVDTANNRILRFPKPFSQTEEVRPDLVIGQNTFGTNGPNQGGISEKTIATASASSVARTGLVFDAQGNLFFSDSLNNRVLRYPVAALSAGTNAPAADVVLGQFTFNTNAAPAVTATDRIAKDGDMREPSGLAIDAAGRLYVVDSLSRVLVFTPAGNNQFGNGQAARRLIGIGVRPAQGQTVPPVSEYTLGSPEGVVMIGNRPAVVDPGFHRITIYDPFDQWPAETESILSPPAKVLIGQSDFAQVRPNRRQLEPSEFTLSGPLAAAYSGTELFVADSGNHRLLVFAAQTSNVGATKVLGQEGFTFAQPNLIEGKELFLFNGAAEGANIVSGLSDGGGVAVDSKSNRLYIADTFNNRVLAYRDARRARSGDKADLVIGQADFRTAISNALIEDRNLLSDAGLFRPAGLQVDSDGALWVADAGNGRVLRFPNPFEQAGRVRANLVLGQSSFNTKLTDASSRTMAYPFGLAFTVEGSLLVSDAAHNRVLFFRKPAGGDFTTGQPAEKVIGQADFFAADRVPGQNRFSSPRHITIDTDDRLYVADSGNNRVLIFDRISSGSNDPFPALTLATGLANAQGIYVSAATGELWVTVRTQNRVLRFPKFDELSIRPASDYFVSAASPLAVTQDSGGNLFVAEGVNRVTVFFGAVSAVNAASFSDRPLSPGMFASIFPRTPSLRFTETEQAAQALPLPTELADVQVLLNDKPVPLYYAGPGQINILVPMGIATNGTAEFQVIRPSSGQVAAAGTVALADVSPALFLVAPTSTGGQIAALNEDNTPNSATNGAARGQIITLFGTGQGVVASAPPDGEAATGPVPTNLRPRVLIDTAFVDDADIQYSGLAPGLPGVWQINVRIPDRVLPNNRVPIAVQVNSLNSNIGPGNVRLTTTIAVR